MKDIQAIKTQLWKIAATCDSQVTPVTKGRMNLIRAEVQEALNMVETVMERNSPSMFKRFMRLINGKRP